MKTMRLGLCAAIGVCALYSSGARAQTITILDTVTSHGYVFTNFNGPAPGTAAGAGTNINGISNNGTAVGYDISDNGSFNNFTVNPLTSKTSTHLNINGSLVAQAFGINSAGTVVGTDGSGNAFILSGGSVGTFIPSGGTSAMAFGINDAGTIVGGYNTAANSPGFIRTGANSYITINSPGVVNTVSATGINTGGQIVGYYLGNDGQDHSFSANQSGAVAGQLTGTPIADPTIPSQPGEPGATFVFSQMLSLSDLGIATGYYGDSTTSQHGYLYNLATGQYTFLDDPDEGFHNGVEVTEITGINSAGEIAGYYSDSNGVFHGFVATRVPEPVAIALLHLLALAATSGRRRRAPSRA
jgi:hypothetical protein